MQTVKPLTIEELDFIKKHIAVEIDGTEGGVLRLIRIDRLIATAEQFARRPIETAPKETFVDVFMADGSRIANAKFSYGSWVSSGSDIACFPYYSLIEDKPVAWSPIPVSPISEQQSS